MLAFANRPIPAACLAFGLGACAAPQPTLSTNGASVVLIPRLEASRRIHIPRNVLAIVSPIPINNVNRLDVVPHIQTAPGVFKPLDKRDGQATDSADPIALLRVTQSSPSIDYTRPITFSGLKGLTTYRFYARAYDTAGTLISTDDALSYLELAVGNDDRPTLGNLPIRIKDQVFSGRTTVTLLPTGDTASLASVGIDVYTVGGSVESLVATSSAASVAGAILGSIALTDLAPDTVYRIRATARDAGGAALATGSVDVPVTNDDAPAPAYLALAMPGLAFTSPGEHATSTSGNFKVQSAWQIGSAFMNAGPSAARCTFSFSDAFGLWTYSSGVTVGPAGWVPNAADATHPLPGAIKGRMIVRAHEGQYYDVATDPVRVVLPGEVLRFRMNDADFSLADNSGSTGVG